MKEKHRPRRVAPATCRASSPGVAGRKTQRRGLRGLGVRKRGHSCLAAAPLPVTCKARAASDTIGGELRRCEAAAEEPMADGRAVRKSPAETGEQRLVARTLFPCWVLKSHGIVPTITGCRAARAGAGWTWTPELCQEVGAWVGFVQGGSGDQLPDFWGLDSPPRDFTVSCGP